MNRIVLDIETLALPEDEIRAKIPAFNPDKVALGNASKPETVERIIEEARKTHGDDIVKNAALDPRYGQVAIVGMLGSSCGLIQLGLDSLKESHILFTLYDWLGDSLSDSITYPKEIIGFNVKAFDLRFCVVRSLILGVKVPSWIWNPRSRHPFSDRVIDLMEVMAFGDFSRKYSSCDDALRLFGIGLNPHGKGSEFGAMWATDKTKALAYNAYDLESELELANRLGI